MAVDASINVTAALARRAATLRFEDLTPAVLTAAKQCLLDWLGVSMAGHDQALVRILVDERLDAGLNGESVVVGHRQRLALPAAVLVNGSMGHALDFDDVHMAMRGHPTVSVMPVALGLAAHLGASGRDALTAFVAGFETECRVGELCGMNHYTRGFHATATIGTLGAASAAGRLLGLDTTRMALALGAAGTQAAGLKSAFGTDCKPLHAGRAAEAGLLAARLAARGFTAQNDILGHEHGFARTQSSDFDLAAALAEPYGGFHLPSTLFKYHAACYLTHASIEALRQLRDRYRLKPADVRSVELHVSTVHFKTCCIEDPKSGLELKFSLATLAAMVLAGVDTASESSYTDEMAARPDVLALRKQVTLFDDRLGEASGAAVALTLADGTRHTKETDVGVPMQNLDEQWSMLEAKFLGLVVPRLGHARAEQIIAVCRHAEQLNDVGALLALTTP